ncbi:MAG TPA: PDZ domain-containing protein [Bacteroidota bacterium]|nr:PDZ domain-containing protein [Bacteroidota bacterium]
MKLLKRLLPYCLIVATTSCIVLAQNDAGSTKHQPREIAWLGVVTQDLNERLLNNEKLKNDDSSAVLMAEGAYVKEVLHNSPADSAGIKKHDVILAFNGKKIEDANDLSKAVRKTTPGEKVTCVLIRSGRQQSITVVVGKKDASHHRVFQAMMPPISLRMFAEQPMLGLRVIEMSEQLAEYFHAPDNEGVLVEDVRKNSPAAKAGFKAGDVILRAGKRTIADVEDIRHELRKHDDGDTVAFEVLRKGEKKTLEVEINDAEEGTPDEIKPTFDELRLNLERMRQELQHSERGIEIENRMIQFAPRDESVTL